MNLAFKDENWRYILLPLYLATYRYGAGTYQVMINGQTGMLAGQQPADWKKVLLAAGAMLTPALALGVLSLILMAVSGGEAYVPLVGMTALFAFVVGDRGL
ncbi:MAG: hypothetical protein M5U34_42820 [Chloroflexi bacterium]|nr:hypothetical protein [Chloroflexota bacterium]